MKTSAPNFMHAVAITALATICLLPSVNATTISSTVAQDNGTFHAVNDPNQQVSTTLPGIFTSGSGFDFTNSFQSLSAISFITVTLTIQDANSSVGDFDFGHLTLGLGGTVTAQGSQGISNGAIDTGLVLNGFRGNGLEDTLTFSGAVTPAVGASILSMLQSNGGRLNGIVLTNNANDTALAPNDMFFGNDLHNATTTLALSDVPEPGTVALLAAGLLALLAPQVRRLRRNF